MKRKKNTTAQLRKKLICEAAFQKICVVEFCLDSTVALKY